jgi:hypothetical protein
MSNQLEMLDMVEEGQSGVCTVELPTGFLDVDGELHKTAYLKEMTGVEEDILASKKMNVTHKISKIIENCVTQIGPHKQGEAGWSQKISELVTTDRLFILIRIRILSLGSTLNFRFECPNEDCKKTSPQSVLLEDFKISGLPDPMLRKWSGVLPRSKKTFECKVQTGGDDERQSTLLNAEDSFSQVFLMRLSKLGDAAPTLKDIKSLSTFDRQFLRSQHKNNEGEIDNSVEISCPHCGTEVKHEMDIGTPDFFFPSEM